VSGELISGHVQGGSRRGPTGSWWLEEVVGRVVPVAHACSFGRRWNGRRCPSRRSTKARGRGAEITGRAGHAIPRAYIWLGSGSVRRGISILRRVGVRRRTRRLQRSCGSVGIGWLIRTSSSWGDLHLMLDGLVAERLASSSLAGPCRGPSLQRSTFEEAVQGIFRRSKACRAMQQCRHIQHTCHIVGQVSTPSQLATARHDNG
jgi:hypothetical protein